MTKQEEVIELENRLAKLKEDIRQEKLNKLGDFLDNCCGKFVRFIFDDTQEIYMYVTNRNGYRIGGSAIVFNNDSDTVNIDADAYDVQNIDEFEIYATNDDAIFELKSLFVKLLYSISSN